MPLGRVRPQRHTKQSSIAPEVPTRAPAERRRASRSGQNRRSNPLHLSRLQFVFVWIVYVSVSVLNATLALVFAGIYYGAYIIRGGYMIESVGLLPLANIPIVVAIYTIISVFFWKLVAQAILGSLYARQLVFKPLAARRAHRKSRFDWAHRIRQSIATHVPFEVTFLAREVVEVTTQSYQVYKCSTLISMHWINDFYVATLALNCWIAPIIHVRLHHRPALQRFIYICSDVVLDFVSTFVVPVSIIFTIVLVAFQNNLANASGDMEYAFDVPMDDTTFSNMVKAVQQVFVVTWLDLFTKVLPFISMGTCLDQIQHYVQPRAGFGSANKQRDLSQATAPPPRVPLARVESPPHTPVAAPDSHSYPYRDHGDRWLQLIRMIVSVRTLHTGFAVWGVCLVGFHIHANVFSFRATTFGIQGCETSPHPWFVNKLSCTVLEINCYRHGFSGYAHEIASALDNVNVAGVGTLIISHCPRLYVPPEIHSLTNLMWLEIFNATLMDWGEDAALVNNNMPALQFLNVIRVNMTELPMGLQSPQFPNRLRDITIALSNITTLPTDLHTKWKRMVNLVIERTALEQIPTTISHMNPSRLSLFNNHITHIPSDFFTPAAHFWILSIAKNPVKAWPATIGSLDRIYLVLMDYTEIAELPVWLTGEGERRAKAREAAITVSAGGSPFCRERLTHSHNTAQAFAGLIIVCREKVDLEIEAYMMSFFQPVRVP